jgi:dipeptidyl-peptidase-4
MFAKFSPDGQRVGYVRENNIYVENLFGDQDHETHHDGSRYIVNGTFDWVYEEELFCRDGFRWSPDSKQIAYWQLNSEGVKEMTLINNTDGSIRSSLQLSLSESRRDKLGRARRRRGCEWWLQLAGSKFPAIRETTICRAWSGPRTPRVVIQQLNRRQDTNIVMLGDARTGKVDRVD